MSQERLKRPRKANHYTVRVTTVLPSGGSITMTMNEVPKVEWLKHFGTQGMLNCFEREGEKLVAAAADRTTP